jgi:hypothetical protein
VCDEAVSALACGITHMTACCRPDIMQRLVAAGCKLAIIGKCQVRQLWLHVAPQPQPLLLLLLASGSFLPSVCVVTEGCMNSCSCWQQAGCASAAAQRCRCPDAAAATAAAFTLCRVPPVLSLPAAFDAVASHTTLDCRLQQPKHSFTACCHCALFTGCRSLLACCQVTTDIPAHRFMRLSTLMTCSCCC